MRCICILFGFTFLISLTTRVNAQNKKDRVYGATVVLMDGSFVKGHLLMANASGLSLKSASSDIPVVLEPTEIRRIKIRRKGKVLKGAIAGTAIGFTTSALLLNADHSAGITYDPSVYIVGGVMGTALGAIMGTGSRYFKIHGNPAKYMSVLPELKSYTLEKDPALLTGNRTEWIVVN